MTQKEQYAARDSLQSCSKNAELKGVVCIVWLYNNKFYYLAPKNWHRFFDSIDMAYIQSRLNRKLSCQF